MGFTIINRTLFLNIDTPYLFADQDGKPVSKDKVTMAFRRACRKAGITNFRLHDLRHHFASYLTMAGENQRTVMELLGHKTPAMTVRCSYLSPEHPAKAVSKLDGLFCAGGEEGEQGLKMFLAGFGNESGTKFIRKPVSLLAPTGVEPVFPP